MVRLYSCSQTGYQLLAGIARQLQSLALQCLALIDKMFGIFFYRSQPLGLSRIDTRTIQPVAQSAFGVGAQAQLSIVIRLLIGLQATLKDDGEYRPNQLLFDRLPASVYIFSEIKQCRYGALGDAAGDGAAARLIQTLDEPQQEFSQPCLLQPSRRV